MPVTRSTQKKESFYAVAKGRQIGIFSTWDEAQPLVKGFAGAKYKKFNSLAQARSFLGRGYENETVTYLKLDASLEHSTHGNGDDASASNDSSGVMKSDLRSTSASSSTIKSEPCESSKSTASTGCPISYKANSEENLSLAILPQSLRGESLQLFQDNSLLLCMTQSNLYQVYSFAPTNVHSWFTSDYIMRGKCLYFTEVDPILICLRHFYTQTLDKGFKSLNEIFTSVPQLNCPLIRSLDFSVICDTSDPLDVKSSSLKGSSSGQEQGNTKYQINLNRTLTYLQGKVNSVLSLVKPASTASPGAGKFTCITDKTSAVSLALEQLHLFLPDSLYEQLLKCSSS